MRIAMFTNEYPPNVYGGAGVHIEYLARELAAAEGGTHSIDVFPFGEQRETRGNLRVHGVAPALRFSAQDPRHAKLLDALVRDLAMVSAVQSPDIVHCHTWYAHLAGCLARPLTGAKLVLTTHSLEPHRPWKVEQLGSAYHATTWIERTAYEDTDRVFAVSKAMKQDVQDLYGVPPERVRVIHNGIDPDEYRPRQAPTTLRDVGVDPEIPIVLFVGRITRQKGILHLVRAIRHLQSGVQVVLCAGAPDTDAIAQEMTTLVAQAKREAAADVIWIPQMLSKEVVIALYSHAAVFVCPSVYEPFGIINLEAMACETPVVAAEVGGIPEIVVPGESGILVRFGAEGGGPFEATNPEKFARDLAARINQLMNDRQLRERFGTAGRKRAEENFSWAAIAAKTKKLYETLKR